MTSAKKSRPGTADPALVIEYTDAQEGFKGWLVRDRLQHAVCAGGMRVQPGLTREKVADLARNMTLKMKIAGLRVDGAKCGIDYDPDSPGKEQAMTRFLQGIKPYVETSYSMGSDLNVEMAELERCAAQAGIPCVKMAVARAQGWDLPYFLERYNILKHEVHGSTVEKLRAGYGVAAAVRTVIGHLNIPYGEATIAVQGFGSLAKAAIHNLTRDGGRITALADAKKCIIAKDGQGLDLKKLLSSDKTLLPDMDYGETVAVLPTAALLDVECDILVPAAIENTVDEQTAPKIKARALVPGANLSVTPAAAEILHTRGILVLPDFLAGSGGSLSMCCLFGPPDHPRPAEVLAQVEQRMAILVNRLLESSSAQEISPTTAALQHCREKITCPPDAKPYGEI